MRYMHAFLSERTNLPFDIEDARVAGTIGGGRQANRAYDVLIAGQAFRRRLTLVTAKVKAFRRIKDFGGWMGEGGQGIAD